MMIMQIVSLSLIILAAFLLPSCSDSGGKSYKVTSISTIKEYGKSIDWHHGKDMIAFGKRDKGDYYDVHVMRSDGSYERCLTCDKEECPQKHNGNPAWHPSGDYIVFTAERSENPCFFREWAVPGTGFNCELWAVTADGEEFFQLTDNPITLPFKAVIHPHFSHDGNKLLWSERIERGDSYKGGWILRIADFVIDSTGPHLGTITDYAPGEKSCFYESHAFSKDDKKILFSGDLESGQPLFGLDIYELKLENSKLKRLTNTTNDWDEHAYYSPNGKMIAWMSSTGITIHWGDISKHEFHDYLKSELWIMDVDGSDKQGLTHFNTAGHPEYMDGKRCMVSDIAWGPDNKRIAALLGYEKGFLRLETKIVMIELEVD